MKESAGTTRLLQSTNNEDHALLLACVVATPLPSFAQSPVSAGSRTAAERIAAAIAARDAGRHEEALAGFRSLTEDPDPSVSALVHEGAAQLSAWRHDYDQAIEHYRKAREISAEKRRDATMGIARTLGWATRYPEALQELDPLLREFPDDPEVRVLEGRVHV